MFKAYFNTLNTLLKDNKNTEYGKKYNFSQIKSLEDYKNKVPISNYSNFKQYIDRMYQGDENILTIYPIYNFNCTSGTEGPYKLFPSTRNSLDTLSDIPFRNYTKIIKKYREQHGKGKRLLLGLFHIDLNKKLPKKILVSESIYYYNYIKGNLDINEYLGGTDLLFDPDTDDYLYEKIWLSILEENIIVIESIYMYEVLQFFNSFEKNYKEIISDIRNGLISSKRKLSEKAKNFLLNVKYSKERLNYVEKECEKGFKDIARRIWKNLKLVTGITSKLFELQNKALEKYIGDITKDSFIFGMSEGIIGISIEHNNYSYSLEPSLGYYEFIPFSEKEEHNDIVDINRIEINNMYELVLTNLSGLYRYKTGDIIKIVNIKNNKIIFEFCFRKNILLNIESEKTSFYHLEKVMNRLNEIIPNIIDFSIGVTIYKNVGTYFLFLSLPENQVKNVNADEIKNEFDLKLCKINFLYEHYRKSESIGEPRIFVMDKEKYNNLIKRESNKKIQIKPKFILSENVLNDILEKMKVNN